MSADLDRLYAKLAERVDAVPLPELAAVRARGEQRRRRSLGGLLAAGAAVLAAMFAAQAAFTPASAPPPQLPWLPPAETAFTPFDGAADPVLPFTGPVRFGMTATAGDRAYAMWMAEDGTEWVGGIDLTGPRPLWPPLSLGRFGDTNGMQVSAGAVLLLTEQGFDNPLIKDGSDTIIAVDPATGKIMWTLPYSFNDTDRVLFDDTLVITWRQRGVTEALDLRTGRVRWTVPGATVPGGTNAMLTADDLHQTGGLLPGTPADRRVVLHLADGRVQVRAAADGRVERELTMPSLAVPADRTGNEWVVDGVLYQFFDGTVRHLPLDGSAAAADRTLPGDGEVRQEPCLAGGLFCGLGYGAGDVTTLTVLDAVTGRERWQRDVGPRVQSVLSAPAGLVAIGEQSVVLGADGGVRATVDGRAMWTPSGNLLVVGAGEVSGLQLATGERVPLGRLEVTGYCSWNATMLTCPTSRGVGVYRYAS